MLESEKHFSSLLFERCGTASVAVAVLLETHVAAACSLWFHPDPDLHCNEHSGQSIIYRRFTHSKKRENKQIGHGYGRKREPIHLLQVHEALLWGLFVLSVTVQRRKSAVSRHRVSKGGYTRLALHSRHKCVLSIPGLQEQSVLLRQPRSVDANTANIYVCELWTLFLGCNRWLHTHI